MRIISRSRHSRRHDRERRMEDTVKYRLQSGAAKVALDHKRQRPMTDAYGKPLPLAHGLAEGYSARGLEKLARGSSKTIVSV